MKSTQILLVIIIVFILSLLIFCKDKKSTNNHSIPEEDETFVEGRWRGSWGWKARGKGSEIYDTPPPISFPYYLGVKH